MDSEETVVAEDSQAATMVAEPKKKADKKKREVPRYHVILWDSDAHTYEYVEKMIREYNSRCLACVFRQHFRRLKVEENDIRLVLLESSGVGGGSRDLQLVVALHDCRESCANHL